MSKRTLYHGTAIENLGSILDKGLLKGCDGGVYLTDTKESAVKWIGFRIQMLSEALVVLEVEVDEKHLIPGVDHSPIMHSLFGAGESILCTEDIPPSNFGEITKYLFNHGKT